MYGIGKSFKKAVHGVIDMNNSISQEFRSTFSVVHALLTHLTRSRVPTFRGKAKKLVGKLVGECSSRPSQQLAGGSALRGEEVLVLARQEGTVVVAWGWGVHKHGIGFETGDQHTRRVFSLRRHGVKAVGGTQEPMPWMVGVVRHFRRSISAPSRTRGVEAEVSSRQTIVEMVMHLEAVVEALMV